MRLLYTLVAVIVCLAGNAQQQNFDFTGTNQTYTVPAGVTSISVKLWGAGGGGGDNQNTGPGGGGAYVSGTLCVTPGEVLTIVVGGRGRQGGPLGNSQTYGGGGAGQDNSRDGGSGGGRSAILRGTTQIAVAGGGGGGGGSGSNAGNGTRYHGGAAGGVGTDGVQGGDRDNFSGGAGGCGGLNNGNIQNCTGGGNATGSQGGNGESGSFTYGGGGGGGGYAGGEGGASGGNNSGGGGGGSSFFSGNILATASGSARIAGNAGDADNGNQFGRGGDRGADDAQNGRIVINANPFAAISGNPTLCEGASVQLSHPTTGGVWQVDNTSIAEVSPAGLVTGVSAGTANVTYSVSDNCGTATATIAMQVNANPIIDSISTTDANCGPAGTGAITIYASGGAMPYNYSVDNGQSYQASATYANLNAGNYQIVVSDVNQCTVTSSAQVNTTTASQVLITISRPEVCANDSTTICALPGFASYIWNTGAQTECIYANIAGDYRVTATDNNNCTSASNVVTLVVHPQPVATLTQSNDTLIAGGGSLYNWLLDGVVIQGAGGETYVPGLPGEYTVLVTDTNGCNTLSNPITIFITALLSPLTDANISIYPNPVYGSKIYVQHKHKPQSEFVELIDLHGRIVWRQFVHAGVNELSVDAIQPGVYLLKSGNVLQKLIRH